MKQLRLLQIADSALPVGGTAHSYGLETLVESGMLTTGQLALFLRDYVGEAGAMEAWFCRAAYRLTADQPQFDAAWLRLNARLGALKPARESRAASAMLGRRLLRLLVSLEPWPFVQQAMQASWRSGTDAHYSTAFGVAGSSLDLDEDATVVGYLQQTLTGLVSACQRLLPLGQTEAARLLWELKPAVAAAAQPGQAAGWMSAPPAANIAKHPELPQGASRQTFAHPLPNTSGRAGAAERSPEGMDAERRPPACFTPLIEWGSMSHITLPTRLFMS
jgi:urease accessory protein